MTPDATRYGRPATLARREREALACVVGRVVAWLRWGTVNLGLLLVVMVCGLCLLVPAAAVGWSDAEGQLGVYVFLWIYLPFTGVVYLTALALIGRWSRRPRRWAFALTPILWLAVPIFALFVVVPGIAATWIAYVVYARMVRLPPRRRRRGAGGPERLDVARKRHALR